MKVFWALILFTLSTRAQAMPQNFPYRSFQAVFVDFQTAHYALSFNGETNKAEYKATITFFMPDTGFPIFDLVEKPQTLKLNGVTAHHTVIDSPDEITQYRLINRYLGPGTYTLTIEGTLPHVRVLEGESIGFNFLTWMTDLKDRSYLEQWLPSNLDYDNFEIQFDINIEGTSREHIVLANGEVQTHNGQNFSIRMPETSHTSGVYLHLLPVSQVIIEEFDYRARNGQRIPVQVYSDSSGIQNPRGHGGPLSPQNFESLKNQVLPQMRRFESLLGPYMHSKIIIYLVQKGGMEFDGVSIASKLSTLKHEFVHSWVARGVTFGGGNSAWLDEAITVWLDRGRPARDLQLQDDVCLADYHKPYIRLTNRLAYTKGTDFITSLNYKTKDQGGLLPFIKYLVKEHPFEALFLEDFINLMNDFYQKDFREFFYQKVVCNEDLL